MHTQYENYISSFSEEEKAICQLLSQTIDANLKATESKIWHSHPVWFLEGNPIVGFNKQKNGIRLMFWSGADFDEPALSVLGKKFKDASIFYNQLSDINVNDLIKWLDKAIDIQWDYKNLIKRKGQLLRIK